METDRQDKPVVQIRRARAQEADLLSDVARKAKAHWGYPPETIAGWMQDLSVSGDEIVAKHVYAALIDGKVAGFYALAPSGPSWAFDHLWVLPRHTRRGIGTALLEHALELAARGGAVSVLVDADPNAEGFYLVRGATRCGEVAAPIAGRPERVRPQLVFGITNGIDASQQTCAADSPDILGEAC